MPYQSTQGTKQTVLDAVSQGLLYLAQVSHYSDSCLNQVIVMITSETFRSFARLGNLRTSLIVLEKANSTCSL